MNIERKTVFNNPPRHDSLRNSSLELRLHIWPCDIPLRDFWTLQLVPQYATICISARLFEDGGQVCYSREPSEILTAPFKLDPRMRRIFELWTYWHNHYVRQGTQRQLSFIAGYRLAVNALLAANCFNNTASTKKLLDGFTAGKLLTDTAILDQAGLTTDRGYVFNSGFLVELPPQAVIDELVSLFDSETPVCGPQEQSATSPSATCEVKKINDA